MKAYDIFWFIVAFMFSANILAASGIFDSTLNDDGTPCIRNCGISENYGVEIGKINQTMTDSVPQKGEELGIQELTISAFGLLIRSLVIMVVVILYSTILMPVFLYQLGLPEPVIAAFSLFTLITAVIGYNQYRARSSLLGVE